MTFKYERNAYDTSSVLGRHKEEIKAALVELIAKYGSGKPYEIDYQFYWFTQTTYGWKSQLPERTYNPVCNWDNLTITVKALGHQRTFKMKEAE